MKIDKGTLWSGIAGTICGIAFAATVGCDGINELRPDQQIRVYADGKQVADFRSQRGVIYDSDHQWSWHDKTGKRIEVYVDIRDAPEQAEKNP